MSALYRTALVIAIIGSINWLLIGLFQYDLVASVLGGVEGSGSRTVFTLVGIAGTVLIPFLFNRSWLQEKSSSDPRV